MPHAEGAGNGLYLERRLELWLADHHDGSGSDVETLTAGLDLGEQLDAATGQCVVRVSISHEKQSEWYEYEHNSVGVSGDGESDCPVLDPFVADDEVKLWVTMGGSFSYDTQIGGNTTVPANLIDKAELL